MDWFAAWVVAIFIGSTPVPALEQGESTGSTATSTQSPTFSGGTVSSDRPVVAPRLG